MSDDADDIPIVETYRGVGIHNCQSRDRIEAVVKPEIDGVIATTSAAELLGYICDVFKPPEARLLAGAKLEATYQIAADSRAVRPKIDLDQVRAWTAGLNSRRWRNPANYGCLFDIRRPGAADQAPRGPEYEQMVEDDRRGSRAAGRPQP